MRNLYFVTYFRALNVSLFWPILTVQWTYHRCVASPAHRI